ncbi:5'-nucleotidase, lipoprotein e(P4) family [Aporhodopirellula aestuarii]|uniref:5'-nucleotidase n=1 Tax=Aporhodopirellula aestuarii TaxID=2950107 RepID=A0ABT0TZX7_9BACT|nr:HAD family acid phosphatase [Aporhodopirellula aestuarii]MCM2370188.1 5'-nucleotidase [Aporhodopirellula aestuarii]
MRYHFSLPAVLSLAAIACLGCQPQSERNSAIAFANGPEPTTPIVPNPEVAELGAVKPLRSEPFPVDSSSVEPTSAAFDSSETRFDTGSAAEDATVPPDMRQTHEDLDATLWMQTSAEYVASCRQAFRTAEEQLLTAINVPSWSADLIQQSELAGHPPEATPLPTAVILDIDETVLNNSPYQARLIQQDGGFQLNSWHEWVEEAAAEAVPGALEFLEAAEDAGVTVFFVTNRQNSVENATRRNLESLGLSKRDAPDRILSKQERDEWTSDKSSRRAHIAKRYRILLLIGDDLNDFVSIGNKPTAQARRELAVEHADLWGVKWIQLPNASYGGWERSLYDWNDAAEDALKLRKKYEALSDGRSE